MRLLPLTLNSPRSEYMQMPRWLFNEDIDLSTEAKFLYMLLYDAASVSKKNNNAAADGTIYVWYTLQTVQEKMHCSDKTATKLFNELEQQGYICRKKQGVGRPSIIYLFHPEEAKSIKTTKEDPETTPSPTETKMNNVAARLSRTAERCLYDEDKQSEQQQELEAFYAQTELVKQRNAEQEAIEKKQREELSKLWKEKIELAKNK